MESSSQPVTSMGESDSPKKTGVTSKPPPYSELDPTSSNKTDPGQPRTSNTPSPSAPPSTSEPPPSAPPSDHLSPALLIDVDLKTVHPEGPPPSYDSICVTQPKASTAPIPTISMNVPPPSGGWSYAATNRSPYRDNCYDSQPPTNTRTNTTDEECLCCTEDAAFTCYCFLMLCRCCIEIAAAVATS